MLETVCVGNKFEMLMTNDHNEKVTNKMIITRDNNAEGIVFRKRLNNRETFSGS